MGIKLSGKWKYAQRVLDAVPAQLDIASQAALLRIGEGLVAKMKARFRNLEPPQARTTKMTGGKGKPLMRTGELRKSIAVTTSAPGLPAGGVFIGVPRSAERWRLAEIHEFGRTIVQPVTPKMHRFLMAKFAAHAMRKAQRARRKLGKLKKEGKKVRITKTKDIYRHLMSVAQKRYSGVTGKTKILVTHIPARPFVGPVWQEAAPRIPRKFAQELGKELDGMLGTPDGGGGG